MSNLIHRYTSGEYVLLNSQRARDRRIDACAGLTSTPRATSTPSSRASQQRGPLHSSNDKRREQRDHQKLNVSLLREVEERNKIDRENKKLQYITSQIAEQQLRDQHSGGRRPTSTAQLATNSPRRIVRDMSDAAEREDAASHHHHQRLPDYLLHRIKEQREQKDLEIQAVAVADSERNFPAGQEPLNPDVTERTREFLELRVAELSKQLHDMPFRSSCSLLGQRRKADIEQQLRDAESALARFNFPVVFVRASKPRPVIQSLRR